jgi:hypothetical protein
VMDFSLFLLAPCLLWDNFLISEMTSIHLNYTTKKTPCQPQSVHSVGMLIAENVKHLCCFGILRSYSWCFLADILGQHLVVVKFLQQCW